MATRSTRFCNHAGCNTLTTDTYCTEHTPFHPVYTDTRRNSRQRGYDTQWEKVRKQHLSAHPLCKRCEDAGRTVVATMVHHIKAIRDGGPRLDRSNLMSLCRDCHEMIEGRKRADR